MDDVKEHVVIFATRFEARSFNPPQGVSVFYSGIGKDNAKNCIEKLLKKHRPHCVVNSGFAGGLNPKLPAGAIVYKTTENDDSFFRTTGALSVKIHCSDKVITSVEEKRSLFLETGSDVVDMESNIIFNVCCEEKIPCYVIRIISDDANTAMPVDFNNVCYIVGGVVKIFTVPGHWSRLKDFSQQMRVSAKILGEYLSRFFASHIQNSEMTKIP